jgi:hypothetical protein
VREAFKRKNSQRLALIKSKRIEDVEILAFGET